MATERMDGSRHFLDAFADPAIVAGYEDNVRRFLPGLDALHRMTGLLVAETAPPDANILVVGAGGGMELRAMAESFPDWHFVGVDPSREMLRLAKRTLAGVARRVDLIEGTVDDAPPGPFDGATCLLTLHFLDPVEREATVRSIHRRLKPGASLVAAHGSFPQAGPDERMAWLSRYAAYAIASGADP